MSDSATGDSYSIYCGADPPLDSLKLVIQDESGNMVHQGTMKYGSRRHLRVLVASTEAMPEDREEIQYTGTIICNTNGLFETMTATVAIPVRRVASDREL